ncbi:type II CAAX endopeptidase family protein [Halalkalibacterium halodurans]|jgi:membrane protease YdiL (CAAX protease family)|uniref:CAAX protease n=1 Tax=Halalkalibacterium halodurans TaxID=86665 RepID=A0A0M0KKR7_ALKHA|nr:type II CAAX endopeptidase family protein [Halalkalibacterium halodurans]MDY7222180.1 type II CAAX endopeptidase family protein [Halalkalibacterium halodurans]MDY7241401.1 type II CAAX endopeptidase family protein [Halalkalibacterium halodurans]MED3646754.1 type II CAAX endopeptidase family protein [Halalkalibacterium halodurans]MED4081819.1 type II CAAX endopeptidase family protein [Halalkalibacterium halodurans]MED4086444.1 type II CAAX endopeptidase family protein [Halalkalibacterium hal
MKRQQQLIKQMTDRELLINLYLSQTSMLVIAFILGWWWFGSWDAYIDILRFEPFNIFVLGGGAAVLVVTVDIVLYRYVPKEWMDDGGINERVFRNRSTFHIAFLSLVVAVAEETLFRGIIQQQLGLVIASLVFALVHFRYLHKPILFISIVAISFLLGVLFLVTGNLLVTIFAHFCIDFLLGIFLRNMLKSSSNRV